MMLSTSLRCDGLMGKLLCRAGWFTAIIVTVGLVMPQIVRADLDAVMGWEVWVNTGNSSNLWERRQQWDLPCQQRSYTHPSFCDLDNDGDYDAYVTATDTFVKAFKNTGSDTMPSWQRNTAWDFYPSGMNAIFWADFVDLNNDGRCDLSIATHNIIRFYQNTGTTLFAWTREPAWDVHLPGKSNLGCGFGDLDDDGDYDFIVRMWSGEVKAFENTGSSATPAWQEKPSWALPSRVIYFSLGDLDGDGDIDVLGEGNWPTSTAFENVGDAVNPVWSERAGWGISSAWYATLIDIDSDGPTGIETGRSSLSSRSLTVSPNPFQRSTVISYQVPENEQYGQQLDIRIYDVAGRTVDVLGNPTDKTSDQIVWFGVDQAGEKLPAGTYLCLLRTANRVVTSTVTIVR